MSPKGDSLDSMSKPDKKKKKFTEVITEIFTRKKKILFIKILIFIFKVKWDKRNPAK